MRVLGIDPGTDKCGLAVVCAEAGVIVREVRPAGGTVLRALELIREHGCECIVIGGGTGSGSVCREFDKAALPVPVEVVDERFTTLRARERYFRDHPPRGLRRLVPVGLQNPREPYDDYVAVILAERWIEGVLSSGS